MNKKEQAHVAQLEKELLKARAFRFTDLVKPDLPPPSSGSGNWNDLTKGYQFWTPAVYLDRTARVTRACSSSVSHGDGWEKTSTQGPAHLYSSELLAWRAARNEVEQAAAALLANIDSQIQRCLIEQPVEPEC